MPHISLSATEDERADMESYAKVQMSGFTHFNAEGRAKMVDVSEKPVTLREAVACGTVYFNAETFGLVVGQSRMHDQTLPDMRKDVTASGEMEMPDDRLFKGDVLSVAQVAGIMAAKRTAEIIPMCHPIVISGVDLSFYPDMRRKAIDIIATVRSRGETGVEMEALTAVSAAALTIYDMCKAVQKDIEIGNIRLLRKCGGKSGEYEASSGIAGSGIASSGIASSGKAD